MSHPLRLPVRSPKKGFQSFARDGCPVAFSVSGSYGESRPYTFTVTTPVDIDPFPLGAIAPTSTLLSVLNNYPNLAQRSAKVTTSMRHRPIRGPSMWVTRPGARHAHRCFTDDRPRRNQSAAV